MAGRTVSLAKLSCRPIGEDDLAAATQILYEGFAERPLAFWQGAIRKLATRSSPDGYPRYGYLLISDSAPVGCLLTIFAAAEPERGLGVRCSLSAHYTRAQFRSFASLMTMRALRHKEVTYLNLTPAPQTVTMLEAHGYQRFCVGGLLIAPQLTKPSPSVTVEPFRIGGAASEALSAVDQRILADHADMGCISLIAAGPDGPMPFVLQRRRVIRNLLPVTQLIYCRQIADFARVAGNLGRHLGIFRAPLMLVDADGPMPALHGRMLQLPKYYKGPQRPRIGDLSYTELPILGV